jgi:uncharacterized protein (DUF2345 family)
MRQAVLLSAFLFFGSMSLLAQASIETSATTHEVRINDEKKIRAIGGEARLRERKGKAIRKGRPVRKHHKDHSEAGVFKRHNHFKAASAKSRQRGTRKNAPAAPKR